MTECKAAAFRCRYTYPFLSFFLLWWGSCVQCSTLDKIEDRLEVIEAQVAKCEVRQ